jgi:hypothetical protein
MINITLNIEEGITTSPCSYTRNMGSTAKNVIKKNNQTTCQDWSPFRQNPT